MLIIVECMGQYRVSMAYKVMQKFGFDVKCNKIVQHDKQRHFPDSINLLIWQNWSKKFYENMT